MAQNYYQILGVGRKATGDEIQVAYRKLVAEVYPGVNRGEAEATDRMKEINRAYETLRNVEKRREYDEILMPGAAKPAASGQTAGASRTERRGSVSTGPSASMFTDAFNTMRDQARVNATGKAETAPTPADSGPMIEIWLTPREASEGTEKKIKVNGKLIRLKIGIRY